MEGLNDIKKEEFIQCYNQYRWLDDTRTKYVDRFFILLALILGARLQFNDFFIEHYYWYFVLYFGFMFVSICATRSVIVFRRQQRGQSLYLNLIRKELLENMLNSEDYKKYNVGRKVYTSTYIELILLFITLVWPFVLIEPISKFPFICANTISILLVSGLEVFLFFFLITPFCRYNFAISIDWNND